MPDSQHALWSFMLFPGIAMLLGWGLRGFIGGGPFGAMIPGAFVAMSLSLLLGLSVEQSGIVAVFGAVGIGFGGGMTYGQTIGFLRDRKTIAWGLLGLTLKGMTWGLVGGTMLGLAFSSASYGQRTTVVGLGLMLVATRIGIKLINDPKRIYFSNRYDKPRGESWAGLILGAIALLVYLKLRGNASEAFLPMHFALWGALGGGIGFGLGGCWMALGPKLRVNQRLFEWWKLMEFTFGLLFGIALGLCTFLNLESLSGAASSILSIEELGSILRFQWVFVAAIVASIFWGIPGLIQALYQSVASSDRLVSVVLREIVGLFRPFPFLGVLLLTIGLHSVTLAWQIALTLTFCHTVIDLNRDMHSENGLEMKPGLAWCILVFSTGAFALLVAHWLQNDPATISPLFLLLLWSCYLVALAKGIIQKSVLFPTAEALAQKGGRVSHILDLYVGWFTPQTVFLVSTLVLTWFLLR